MEPKKSTPGARIRYFPNIFDENIFHDGTVIDGAGTIEFDDGFQLTEVRDESGVIYLSEGELDELGIDFDAPNNQFTMRKGEDAMSADYIALAVAENRMQLAFEEKSGELIWLQKNDGEDEFGTGEKTKGYKFVGDPSLPLDVQAQMMTILAQVANHVANHGLKKPD